MKNITHYTLAMVTAVSLAFSIPVFAQDDYDWDLHGDGTVTGGTPPDKSSKCTCTYRTQVKVGNTTHTFQFQCTNVPVKEVDTPTGKMYTCIGTCPDPDTDKGAKPKEKKPYDCGDATEVQTPRLALDSILSPVSQYHSVLGIE